MKVDLADLGERALWTGVQASVALLVVELGDVQVWWAAPVALALSAAKNWIRGRVKAGANG